MNTFLKFLFSCTFYTTAMLFVVKLSSYNFMLLILRIIFFSTTNCRFILSLLTCHLNDSMVAMHLYYGDGWIGL